MRSRKLVPFLLLALFALVSAFSVQKTLFGQSSSSSNSSSNRSSNSSSSNSNNNNNDNGSSYANSGVLVNPDGELTRVRSLDGTGRVSTQWLRASQQAARDQLTPELRDRKQIYISLNRMEKAAIDNGGATEEMRNLAGLLRITHVFYFPDSRDIVISGPAEGWMPGSEGINVGLTTQTPTCQLDDLVVALRAFGPDGKDTAYIGCSIDPTQEGLSRMQDYVNAYKRSGRPGGEEFVDGIKKSLGRQMIRIDGISPNTHAAQVLVAADFRMKLIGFGMEEPPVRMDTFVGSVGARGMKNALVRWFFVPDYETVLLSEDRLGMELIGNGVKLLDEAEAVNASGQRQTVKSAVDPASRKFTKSFTDKYPAIARQAPIYAQLRNVIDMLIVAAHIQKEDYYAKADWSMGYFGDENRFAVEIYTAPTSVEPIVNGLWKGKNFLAPTGGVTIEAGDFLTDDFVKFEDRNQVTDARGSATVDLPEGRWWWGR